MKTNLGAGNHMRSRKKENSICRVCGKDFCSIKALHGHMRSHLDRSWRGIQPPSTPSPSPSSSPVAASLPRWSVTARRGRNSASSASASASTVSDDQVVVNSLMFLSKSENNSDDDTINMGEQEQEQERERERERGLECEMSCKKKRKISTRVKKFKEIEDQLKTLKDSVLSEFRFQLKDLSTPKTMMPIQIKKLYRCNSCDKEFSSHQALGGHKSSHNKLNKTRIIIQPQTTVRINKRRMLDFDLNELPPMDGDDDKDGEAAM